MPLPQCCKSSEVWCAHRCADMYRHTLRYYLQQIRVSLRRELPRGGGRGRDCITARGRRRPRFFWRVGTPCLGRGRRNPFHITKPRGFECRFYPRGGDISARRSRNSTNKCTQPHHFGFWNQGSGLDSCVCLAYGSVKGSRSRSEDV